jgi:hypothetical protein
MIALGLRNLLLKTLGTVGPSGHAHQTVRENLILPKYMFKHSQTIIKYVAKQMLMNLVVQPYLHPFVHVKNPPLVYVFFCLPSVMIFLRRVSIVCVVTSLGARSKPGLHVWTAAMNSNLSIAASLALT